MPVVDSEQQPQDRDISRCKGQQAKQFRARLLDPNAETRLCAREAADYPHVLG